jgi:hypothetical protein
MEWRHVVQSTVQWKAIALKKQMNIFFPLKTEYFFNQLSDSQRLKKGISPW